MYSSFEGRILCAFAFALALSGCGGAQGTVGPFGFAPSPPAARYGSAPWMSPEAKTAKLLYISDPGTDDVDVYSYPNGKPLGALTGFNEPWGLCSDRTGHVFVADVWHYRVVEYAHGGVKPIKTIKGNQGHPISCSVDPQSNDLAVVYYFLNEASRYSEVAVYAHEKGVPKVYDGSKIANDLNSCTYDNRGNLFVDGLYGYASIVVGLAELPKGGKELVDVSLPNHIGHLSSVQWTGNHLAMGDQSPSESYPALIYQYDIDGTTATKVGTTELVGTTGLQQFWAHGGKVGVPSGSVRLYHYPAGGTPLKTLDGFTNPFGITLSIAPDLKGDYVPVRYSSSLASGR
jgi:NHL repeat